MSLDAYGLYRALIPTLCGIFLPCKILFSGELIVWYMASNKFQESKFVITNIW